jgi:signal transduction histidine kinase/CheY-like chemotaxis protein
MSDFLRLVGAASPHLLSPEQARHLFDTMPQGVVFQAEDGAIIAANQTAERILGLTCDQMMGKTSMDPGWRAVREDGTDLPGAEHPAMVALRTATVVGPFVMGVFHPVAQAYSWISIHAAPLFRDGRTAPFQVCVTFEDITARKRAEADRDASERLLSDTLRLARVGHWEYDPSDQCFVFNDHYYALHRTTADAVGGYRMTAERFARSFVPPGEAWRVADALGRAMATGDPAFEEGVDTKILCADGSVLDVHVWFRIEKDASGATVRVIGANQDITERKAAEQVQERLQAQLLQSQKMESVGRLAGGIAHDFNNMLGVIMGHAELATMNAEAGEPVETNLREIQKAAEHSAALTRQLLAFARKQTISPRVLDLNAVIGSLITMVRRLIGEDIALGWTPGDDVWPVKMDPAQVDQIVINLAVNARDAITAGGAVTIETSVATIDDDASAAREGAATGDFVVLTVSDNGEGMDDDVLAHLFEPFFTTKGVGRGTGLGLATVYGIVKQNDGFIDVRSEHRRGTTFRIYLPRYVGESAGTGAAPAAAITAPGHETILLVEDEPAVLDMGRMMLERLGYRVLAAATPADAIREAHAHAGGIHLLMADVVMPGMNGRDLARVLQAGSPRLKRLFMSGYTADIIARRGVLEEGTHFIQKPFSMRELAARVREALDN